MSQTQSQYLKSVQLPDGTVVNIPVVPEGGTTGQILKKTSATNYDVGWGSGVTDVTVNGSSVVTNGTAAVTVPTALSQLTDDATHRVVTDTEKTTWNNKQTALVGTGTGQNIKTINNTNVLGTGNISVGTYSKPANGIPASDIASEVTNALIPSGGTTGQVLTKNSSTNYDVSWVDSSNSSVVNLTSGNNYINLYIDPDNETNGTIDLNIMSNDDEGFYPLHIIFDLGYNSSGTGDYGGFTIWANVMGYPYDLENIKYGSSTVGEYDVISIELGYVGVDSYVITSGTVPSSRWYVASASGTTINGAAQNIDVNVNPRINNKTADSIVSNIYAPITTGTQGQVLTWPTSGSTPIWANPTGGINSSNNSISDIIAVSETYYANLVNDGRVNPNTMYIVIPVSN